MFPASTMIRILELQVNELSIDLLQEQQHNATLGERIEEQDDLITELRNKITALEAIIQEDAKKERHYSHVYTSLGMQKTIGRARGRFDTLKPTRRKLEDSETVQVGDIVVKYGKDDYAIRNENQCWTAALFTGYDGVEVWRPL